MRLRVYLDEILPSKEASRTLPQAIDRLVDGTSDHIIITRRNKPRAVLITIELYERLLGERGSCYAPALFQLARALPELARQLEQAKRRIAWLQERGVEELRGDVKLAREQRDNYARQWGQAEREKDGAYDFIAYRGLSEPFAQWCRGREISEQNTKPSGEVGEEA